jgi:hypothetical protein
MTEVKGPTWNEQAGRLVIDFPAEVYRGSKAMDWAILVIVSLFAIPLPIFIVQMLMNAPDEQIVWLISCLCGEIAIAFLWRACLRAAYRSDIPRLSHPQSSLIVEGDVLKVERAGVVGELDVSWSIAEIADIRLCSTIDHVRWWLSFILPHLLTYMFPPRGPLVRISIMLASGAVEDTVVRAPEGGWILEIEERLRQYLELTEQSANTEGCFD